MPETESHNCLKLLYNFIMNFTICYLWSDDKDRFEIEEE